MSRTNDRRHAIKLVFELGFVPFEDIAADDYFKSFEFIDEDGVVIPEVELPKVEDIDKPYVLKTFNGVAARVGELDGMINESAPDWSVDRISKVELAILRLGLYEMFHDENVPVPVAVNEAADAARFFGGPDAADFVYAVLSKAENYKAEERQNK